MPHPLQFRSLSNIEMLQVVDDSIMLPISKKVEWELDLLREFDEKRMEQFEKFLVSRRMHRLSDKATMQPTGNKAVNAVFTAKKQGSNSNSGNKVVIGGNSFDYYRDKGRQATR